MNQPHLWDWLIRKTKAHLTRKLSRGTVCTGTGGGRARGGGIKREIGINDEDLSLEYVEFEG